MITLQKQVQDFMNVFEKAGFEIFVVGGAVRDLLLEKEVKDWDFATNATPEEIQKLFPESFYDNNFGTVGIIIEGQLFEVTPYRKEGKYSDTRHPDQIGWAKTIEEDLARRDFTVNAIALNKTLLDPYHGQEDLQNKTIRCVGDPSDRFNEDALRMMRAVRIATQLGFVIEEKTFLAIQENAALITKVSQERIRDELIKILSSDYPADGVHLLHNANLLGLILPELTAEIGVTQQGTHHLDDVYEHSLKALFTCQNKNWVIRFATLLHDVGKPITFKIRGNKATFYAHETVGANIARRIANRLHLSKEDREKLVTLVRWHMFSVSEFLTDAAVRRFIRRVGKENTTDMLDVRTADRLGSGVKPTSWRHEEFKERIIEVQKHIPSVNDLVIDGEDIMRILNIKPGPQVGKILAELFAEISENPSKNTKDYLLARLDKFSQTTKSGAALKIEE